MPSAWPQVILSRPARSVPAERSTAFQHTRRAPGAERPRREKPGTLPLDGPALDQRSDQSAGTIAFERRHEIPPRRSVRVRGGRVAPSSDVLRSATAQEAPAVLTAGGALPFVTLWPHA